MMTGHGRGGATPPGTKRRGAASNVFMIQDTWQVARVAGPERNRSVASGFQGYANVAPRKSGETPVKAFLAIVGWCLLLVLCWPLAVLVIVLWPLLWLLSLPFRVVGITFDAMFALLRALLFLPARLFGYRGSSAGRLS